jgi:lipid-binding SYLF domain-containing protein
MTKNLMFAATAALLVFNASTQRVLGQAQEAGVVTSSTAVLDEICRNPATGIPRSMLSGATAVAVIPDVIKIGFIGAVRRGKGVVLVRQTDGSWSNPIFITLTGGGIGFQAGAQSSDVILVFKSRESVNGMLSGKFTLGADAAIAAGPIGRQAAAATDAQLRAEILSYSRSRGLFAGVSLEGSALTVDNTANAIYYGVAGVTPADVFTNNRLAVPAPTVALKTTLAKYTDPATAVVVAPPTQPVPLPPSVGTPQPQSPLQASGQNLTNSARQLYPKLDPRWQTYLAMPRSVFEGAGPSSIPELELSLERFNAIELDPKYDAISKLESFQATKQALIQYIRIAKSQPIPRQSALPQPPVIQPRR